MKSFQERIDFDNIGQLRKHQFYGNHAMDHQAFSGIERFIRRPDVELADKVEAIMIQGIRGMGFTEHELRCGFDNHPPLSDEELVASYLNEEE